MVDVSDINVVGIVPIVRPSIPATGQRRLTNSLRTGSVDTQQPPRKEGHGCGSHGPGQSILGTGRSGCGSLGTRHVVAKCRGLTASFVHDAAARRSAGQAPLISTGPAAIYDEGYESAVAAPSAHSESKE